MGVRLALRSRSDDERGIHSRPLGAGGLNQLLELVALGDDDLALVAGREVLESINHGDSP